LAARPDRALPVVSPQRDALLAPKPSFDSARAGWVPAPPRGDADGSRTWEQSQARNTYERDAYNRDADIRDADNRYGDERDDVDAGNYAPRYAPRYGNAPPPRFYNRGDEGYGDNAGDNSGDRDDYDNGPTANNAGADAYNAPYAYRPYAYRPYAYGRYAYGRYAYRPYAYGRFAYGPPARPHLVRGPYGRWYLLLPYSR
jgi:hypothetical protein